VARYTSLAELGMDSMMAVEIKQTLEREHDIFLTAQDIRNLNFFKLMSYKEREKAQTRQNIEKTTFGIHMLIRILGNEKLSTDIPIKLQTRMDPHKIKVFLLPGIQGAGNVFNPLASKIRSMATVLQYGIMNNHMSIPEYADHLLPVCICKRT